MSSLNEEIMEILENNIESVGDYDGGHYLEGREMAAKEIEKLIINEKIEVLLDIYNDGLIGKDMPSLISKKISELTNQPNQTK